MKPSRYSEFANYILLAYNSNLNADYEAFLRHKEVVAFLNQIASKTGDTFLHNGTIYKKKVTSSEARSLLDGFFQNRCNKSKLRIVANQLKVRI
jgi:hypothetical protein|tara:strand:- start:137 stop:418 length:282 start_codon:yes stop_codon:yes gene_type:complete